MGCLSFTWFLTKIFIVCAVIGLLPGIPPHADYKEYTVARPKALVADLLAKKHLDKAEHLFEGELTGPEAFAAYNGAVYTGIHGGFVVQIDEGQLKPVVKFGQNCVDITEEHTCGRPLGLKFDAAGTLYVADAYYGIFKYNIQKAQKTLLVSADQEIDGKKSKFINDLSVAKDGTVYFTVSSTTFPLNEGLHAVLAPGDGRVVKYDPQTKQASVLAEGLLFPNGIALSATEDFLVFSETVGARVMRLDLNGAKKGEVRVFAEGLPGLPDNIRVDGRDGFYVSLVSPADESHPALPVTLGPFPNIRKFLARLLYLLELPFIQINNIYPNYFCRFASHNIGHLSTAAPLSPEGVTILHIDSQGKIKDALVGGDGSVNHVSDMIVTGDYILLASPYNNFIGRVPRPNVPHQVHVKSVRFEEAVPEKIDDSANRKVAEEAKARQVRDEQARKAAAEAARAKKASEEAAKKAEESARLKEAEESKARLAAEEAKKKVAEEARAKKAAEESARRAAEEAKARKATEERARRAAEEAKVKKLAEEAKARKIADEAKARKAAEELKLKKAAEESLKRKTTEEAKINRASENSNNN